MIASADFQEMIHQRQERKNVKPENRLYPFTEEWALEYGSE